MSSAPPIDAPFEAAPVDAGSLPLGRVIKSAFEVLQRRWQLLGIIGLTLNGPPMLLMNYVTAGLPAGAILPANRPLFFAATLISVAVGGVVHAALLQVVLRDREGAQPALGETLATGLRLMLPMIGLTLLITLGGVLGALLLIVPGIIIFLMWSLASPAVVAEGVGILDALKRSRRLTKGSRWKLLALWTVLIAPLFIFQFGVASIIGSEGAVAAWSTAALDAILSLLFAIASACVTVSAYLELRRLKDGANVEQLAEVFA